MKEQRYLELLKDNKLEQLKELLEATIRDNLALKTNNKSRVNAIKRILKSNVIKARPKLQGCGVLDDKYVFTDTYQLAVINDSLGYEVKKDFPNVKSLCDRFMQSDTMLYVDLEDLLYCYKVKEDYKNAYFNNITFDYNYLKNAIDVMGKDTKIYTNDEKNVLIFRNSNDEMFIVMGKKKF